MVCITLLYSTYYHSLKRHIDYICGIVGQMDASHIYIAQSVMDLIPIQGNYLCDRDIIVLSMCVYCVCYMYVCQVPCDLGRIETCVRVLSLLLFCARRP